MLFKGTFMDFTDKNRADKIEEYILKHILSGYRPNEKIPSELKLSNVLGVSRPTVHKVLSGLTSRGILYRKNGIGTFLAPKDDVCKKVLFIVPEISSLVRGMSHSWFNSAYVIEGFLQSSSSDGVGLNIINIHPDAQPYDQGIQMILKQNPDICMFSDLGGNRNIILGLMNHGIPCIVRNHMNSDLTHCVYGKMREGVRIAVEHLIRNGRRKIAFYGVNMGRYEEIRLLGYKDAMEAAGLEVKTEYLRLCGCFSKDAFDATNDMLESGFTPDAVFGGTDLRCMGILDALKQAGLKIPQDVAVVGSDNLPECEHSDPPLSTVEYPMHEIGRAMYGICKNIFDGIIPGEPVNIGLTCRFIERKSS